jgi:hypothetical protein
MTLTFIILAGLFLLQVPSILTPTVIAVVTALFTVAVGFFGIQYLKDKINSNTRIKGLIGSLLAAYGIVAPFLSSFPRSIGVVLAVVGVVVTLTSGRLQGPSTE